MQEPQRILITGVSGFVGKHMVQACRARYPEAQLFGFTRNVEKQGTELEEVELFDTDLCSFQQTLQAVAKIKPDLIFHLAAQSSVASSWENPIATLQVNVLGLVHLLEAVHKEYLLPRVVIAGSSEQYGSNGTPRNYLLREDTPFYPLSPYAASKAAQDLYGYQYFAAYGLPILRTRSFNHFGPKQAPTFVVASIARQIALIEAGKQEAIIQIGNASIKRDFLPVQNVVAAYIAIAEHGQPGESYNIGAGTAYSINDIVHKLLQHSTIHVYIQEDIQQLRPTDHSCNVADTSLLHAHTGWQPALDIDLALKQTLDYWRAKI